MTTDITVVLDRSGSMADRAQDTRGGFNTFLATQQAGPGSAVLTVVQFDHEYQEVVRATPIRLVAPLTTATYVPRGTTALLDAMGRTIRELGARLAALPAGYRPDHVIVVIVTDGYENASRAFTRAQVFDMVAHQRDVYQWQFVYLGANQDAIAVGADLGVPIAAAMTFTASEAGMRAMYRSVGQQVNSVRSGASASVTFTPMDRADAAAEE